LFALGSIIYARDYRLQVPKLEAAGLIPSPRSAIEQECKPDDVQYDATLIYISRARNNICSSPIITFTGHPGESRQFQAPQCGAFPLPCLSNRGNQQGAANINLPPVRQPSLGTKLTTFNLIVRYTPCH
jgi:hypothetical protein